MKVFKNFFGNNSKISWEEIACKGGSNKSKTLDKYITQPDMIICTSKNENPQLKYGGTWELIDKEFRNEAGHFDLTGSSITSNISSCTIYYARTGHTNSLRINFVTAKALTDTTAELFTIDFKKLGISTMHFSPTNLLAGTDVNNGIIMVNIAWNTGIANCVDIIGRGSATSIASGANAYINYDFATAMDNMLDEYCDKFYWKKVSN